MLPVIPQELFDMILDFLHNDVAALCNAGLVCKSWLPASRFHLFSEIYWKLSALVHRGLELICGEGSNIPPYILRLSIEGDESQFLNETLLRLPLLSNVKFLQLSHIDMTNLTTDTKMKLTTMLKNLKTLHLSNFTFETVDQAVDFIASSPCLEDIDLSGVGCGESCNYSSKAVAPPLKEIRFVPDPLVNTLIDWFCRCRPTPSVHTLDINRLASADDIPTVCNLIRHLGSSLEYLLISSTNSDGGGVRTALSKQIDLSQNTCLRNIIFKKITLYANTWRSRSCGWITSILSGVAHPSLEFVTLVIFLGDVKEIDALELSALENLFLNEPLSNNSAKLCFYIIPSSSTDREAVQAALEDRLPKLEGKKRLEFNKFRTRNWP